MTFDDRRLLSRCRQRRFRASGPLARRRSQGLVSKAKLSIAAGRRSTWGADQHGAGHERLEQGVSRVFDSIWQIHVHEKVSIRDAAYTVALRRIGEAIESQGTQSFFGERSGTLIASARRGSPRRGRPHVLPKRPAEATAGRADAGQRDALGENEP